MENRIWKFPKCISNKTLVQRASAYDYVQGWNLLYTCLHPLLLSHASQDCQYFFPLASFWKSTCSFSNMLELIGICFTIFVLGAIAQSAFPDCTNGPLKNNTVCNPNASTRDRAQALVSALTLEEKLSLTGSASPGVPRLGLPAYQWWQEALVRPDRSPSPTAKIK